MKFINVDGKLVVYNENIIKKTIKKTKPLKVLKTVGGFYLIYAIANHIYHNGLIEIKFFVYETLEKLKIGDYFEEPFINVVKEIAV